MDLSNKTEPEIKETLKDLLKDDYLNRLSACFECGQCVSVCPASRVNSTFRPRKIMHMLLFGLVQELINDTSIWLCTNCYNCEEVCPQGIKVSEIITSLKNMAYREGNFPSDMKKQLDAIKSSGMVYILDDFDMKKRQKLGLPPLSQGIDDAVKLLESVK